MIKVTIYAEVGFPIKIPKELYDKYKKEGDDRIIRDYTDNLLHEKTFAINGDNFTYNEYTLEINNEEI
jgi:hypothetical protein